VRLVRRHERLTVNRYVIPTRNPTAAWIVWPTGCGPRSVDEEVGYPALVMRKPSRPPYSTSIADRRITGRRRYPVGDDAGWRQGLHVPPLMFGLDAARTNPLVMTAKSNSFIAMKLKRWT